MLRLINIPTTSMTLAVLLSLGCETATEESSTTSGGTGAAANGESSSSESESELTIESLPVDVTAANLVSVCTTRDSSESPYKVGCAVYYKDRLYTGEVKAVSNIKAFDQFDSSLEIADVDISLSDAKSRFVVTLADLYDTITYDLKIPGFDVFAAKADVKDDDGADGGTTTGGSGTGGNGTTGGSGTGGNSTTGGSTSGDGEYSHYLMFLANERIEPNKTFMNSHCQDVAQVLPEGFFKNTALLTRAFVQSEDELSSLLQDVIFWNYSKDRIFDKSEGGQGRQQFELIGDMQFYGGDIPSFDTYAYTGWDSSGGVASDDCSDFTGYDGNFSGTVGLPASRIEWYGYQVQEGFDATVTCVDQTKLHHYCLVPLLGAPE